MTDKTVLTDEQIKKIWDDIKPQGDQTGRKFACVFARAIEAAATLSQQQRIEELEKALASMADEFVKVYPIYYYASPWGHNKNEALLHARKVLAARSTLQSQPETK